MKQPPLVLIGFYQEKALGVRYLAAAARARGYEPHIILFKGFHSRTPAPATEEELALLARCVREIGPRFVGLSVMSSLYLETVLRASRAVRAATDAVVGWGGVFATLEPGRAAAECDVVLRGEGERTLPDLLDRLARGEDWHDLPGLAWRDGTGALACNPLPPLEADLDALDCLYPGEGDVRLIEGGRVVRGDPQLKSFTYELCASRGCPFQCSYCSAVSLRRLYPGQRYLRFRSVEKVMEELRAAKARLKRLRVVHFWDEIFSDEPGWVEEFARRYKAEIDLPFRIWGHPLKVDEGVMRCLVNAGLHQIVVGIQSGSPRVRREVFHRTETREQILEAAAVLDRCGVPRIVYDLMLCHPFETAEDRALTLALCRALPGRFSLELHGLDFLPGTDIVDMALEQGLCTGVEMERLLYGTLEEQYGQYWGPANRDWRADPWVALIYLSQFPSMRGKLEALTALAQGGEAPGPIFRARAAMERRERLEDLRRRAALLLKK